MVWSMLRTRGWVVSQEVRDLARCLAYASQSLARDPSNARLLCGACMLGRPESLAARCARVADPRILVMDERISWLAT